MENINQEAMLNEQLQTFRPDTGGPVQIPDQSSMLDNSYNPTDLSGDAYSASTTPTDEQEAQSGDDGTGATSGSPNMERDQSNYGNNDSLGNNDGTEDNPETTDLPDTTF